MRVFGTGDNHLVRGSRWEECKRIHEWIANEVRREKPDLFCVGGDLFDKASTPEEREFAAEWIMSIADVCPFILTTGNHDRHDDAIIMSRLRARHPIIVEQRAQVHHIAGAAIAAVAWPKRSNIAVNAPANASIEQIDMITRDAFRNLMRGFGQQLAEHDGPRMMLGHFMADGSKTSVGQPLIGQSMSIGLEDLALSGASLVLMSHIHLPQQFKCNGSELVYMGSPYRTTFGECEQKSYTVAEYDGPNLVGWHRVPTPCVDMVLLESNWDGQGFDINDFKDLGPIEAGTEIRFRFKCPRDQRGGAMHVAGKLKKEWLMLGAESVVIEAETLSVSTARSPEVTEAHGLPDKLDAMWKLREETISPSRRGRLIDQLAIIEAETL